MSDSNQEQEQSDHSVKIDLYKLEYKQAGERYENIYKAIWQNLSYIAILSSAVFAFGESLPIRAQVALPLAALNFWYFGIFVPLNRYGDEVLRRLEEIEGHLHELTGAEMGHYTKFASGRRPTSGRTKRVWCRKLLWRYRKFSASVFRVRRVVGFVGYVSSFALLTCLFLPESWLLRGQPSDVASDGVAEQLILLEDKLDKLDRELIERIGSLEDLLRNEISRDEDGNEPSN